MHLFQYVYNLNKNHIDINKQKKKVDNLNHRGTTAQVCIFRPAWGAARAHTVGHQYPTIEVRTAAAEFWTDVEGPRCFSKLCSDRLALKPQALSKPASNKQRSTADSKRKDFSLLRQLQPSLRREWKAKFTHSDAQKQHRLARVKCTPAEEEAAKATQLHRVALGKLQ